LQIGGVVLTFLDDLSPEDLLILTNAITISLSKDKSVDEINVLGNFIVGIGCLMLTIASQQQFIETKKTTTDDAIIG
jgi:hypothetical protein